jgi:hypothetical protein
LPTVPDVEGSGADVEGSGAGVEGSGADESLAWQPSSLASLREGEWQWEI